MIKDLLTLVEEGVTIDMMYFLHPFLTHFSELSFSLKNRRK